MFDRLLQQAGDSHTNIDKSISQCALTITYLLIDANENIG